LHKNFLLANNLNMKETKRLAWELFVSTGEIGYYNLFKALEEK